MWYLKTFWYTNNSTVVLDTIQEIFLHTYDKIMRFSLAFSTVISNFSDYHHVFFFFDLSTHMFFVHSPQRTNSIATTKINHLRQIGSDGWYKIGNIITTNHWMELDWMNFSYYDIDIQFEILSYSINIIHNQMDFENHTNRICTPHTYIVISALWQLKWATYAAHMLPIVICVYTSR